MNRTTPEGISFQGSTKLGAKKEAKWAKKVAKLARTDMMKERDDALENFAAIKDMLSNCRWKPY